MNGGLAILRSAERTQFNKHLYVLTNLEVLCVREPLIDNEGVKVTISVNVTRYSEQYCLSKRRSELDIKISFTEPSLVDVLVGPKFD
jgi:hypothetical protein